MCRDYGIELKQMGPDNLMGRCPFHEDKTPSFGVTPSKNLWNCLAGCGGGDTLQLVMKKEGVSFRRAVEILRRKTGPTPAVGSPQDAPGHGASGAGGPGHGRWPTTPCSSTSPIFTTRHF